MEGHLKKGTENADSILSEANRRRIGLWFIGLFVSAWVFSYPLTRMGNPDGPNWSALVDLNRKKEVVNLAIVGDSHAHTSLSPKLISEGLGDLGIPLVKGHNFAVDGTDALHHAYFINQGLLKRERPPSVLIYVPNALQYNAKRLNNRLEQLGPSFISDLSAAGAPLELRLDLFTMTWFKPYRYRPLLMKQVSMYTEIAGKKSLPFQTRFMGLHWEDEPDSRKYYPEPDGFEPFDVLDFTGRFSRGAKAYLSDYAALEVSDWHFRLIQESFKRCRQAGVQVVVIEPPLSNWFQTHLMDGEKYQLWKKRIEAAAKAEDAILYDFATYFNGPDQEFFGDPTHMNRNAAARFSQTVAEQLAREAKTRAKLEGVRLGTLLTDEVNHAF